MPSLSLSPTLCPAVSVAEPWSSERLHNDTDDFYELSEADGRLTDRGKQNVWYLTGEVSHLPGTFPVVYTILFVFCPVSNVSPP